MFPPLSDSEIAQMSSSQALAEAQGARGDARRLEQMYASLAARVERLERADRTLRRLTEVSGESTEKIRSTLRYWRAVEPEPGHVHYIDGDCVELCSTGEHEDVQRTCEGEDPDEDEEI